MCVGQTAEDTNALGDPAPWNRKELVVFVVDADTADLQNAAGGAFAATFRMVSVKGTIFGVVAATMGMPIGVAIISSPVGWVVSEPRLSLLLFVIVYAVKGKSYLQTHSWTETRRRKQGGFLQLRQCWRLAETLCHLQLRAQLRR